MDDEVIFLNITKEFESGDVDEALWAKAIVLSEGDEVKAKYKYINLKVDKIKENNKSIENLPIKVEHKDNVVGNIINNAKGKNDKKSSCEKKENNLNDNNDWGYEWWKFWGWLNLTLGNIILIFTAIEYPVFGIIYMIIINVLMIQILKYNKYAFLIATIISFNPVLWLINGIYLKNRWKYNGPKKVAINILPEKPIIKDEHTEQEKFEKIKSITEHYINSRNINDFEMNNLYKNLMKRNNYEHAIKLIRTYGTFSGVVYSFFGEQLKNDIESSDTNSPLSESNEKIEEQEIIEDKAKENEDEIKNDQGINNNKEIEDLLRFYINANMIKSEYVELLRNKLRDEELFIKTKKLIRTYGNYSKVVEIHFKDLSRS